MRYYCHFCHKSVTNEVPDDTVVRAIVCCPECIEAGKIIIPEKPSRILKPHERNRNDDMGWDEKGQPIAIGPAAADEHEAIINDPDSRPVLLVAENERGLGVRVFGAPSHKVSELLDHIAFTYRKTVEALEAQKQ